MRREQHRVVVALLIWCAVLILLYVSIGFVGGEDRSKCPYKTAGNPNASLSIKYFGNPFCIWCLIGNPKIEKLTEQKGKSFFMEYYDNRYCPAEVDRFGVSAIPFFVFNDTKQAVSYPGYLEDADMRSIICQSTGDCE